MNETKNIFVLENSNEEECEIFREKLNSNEKNIVCNQNVKLFKVLEGEMFEVVQTLKEMNNINIDFSHSVSIEVKYNGRIYKKGIAVTDELSKTFKNLEEFMDHNIKKLRASILKEKEIIK